MLTLIFASGDLATPPELPDLLHRAGLIIAADGGANHCASLGLTPDILVGDLDSIEQKALQQLQTRAVEIHRHPREKDATDLELALDLALSRGATEVWLVAVLGGRWDMSLGNILLAAHDKYRAMRITLAGEGCRMHVIHPGEPFILPSPRPGRTVSLLPLAGDVHGLTLDGFRYPLHEATLAFGSSRGTSNMLTAETGTVRLHRGVLLCICLDE